MEGGNCGAGLSMELWLLWVWMGQHVGYRWSALFGFQYQVAPLHQCPLNSVRRWQAETVCRGGYRAPDRRWCAKAVGGGQVEA